MKRRGGGNEEMGRGECKGRVWFQLIEGKVVE